MSFENIPEEVVIEINDDTVKFEFGGMSTDWISKDDSFIQRIDNSRINRAFRLRHLTREFEVKNTLDKGIACLESGNSAEAIDRFDEVLFYDPLYFDALISKSHALFTQNHYVKSLRYYRKAIQSDDDFNDESYLNLLLKKSDEEISHFPEFKKNIYFGDEYFSKKEFQLAVESYDLALQIPSKFTSKILIKKGNALVKLGRFDEALGCFDESLKIKEDDFAYFAKGLCEFNIDLNVNDRFREILFMDKKYMLKQILILNILDYFSESLEICDYMMENHFNVDELYLKLIDAKIVALNNLGEDSGEMNEILNNLKN